MTGRKKRKQDYFITVQDDGLLTYDVGPWAADKYRCVGMYAEMFATGMKNLWDRRVYLDLFSGPGHSRVRGTGRIVLGSPMIALRVPDRFDTHIFANESAAALEALKSRVDQLDGRPEAHYVPGDANAVVDRIIEKIPTASKRTLSFCFLDPYRLNIHFDTVRRLADGRSIDFLILLALYVDANRNERTYVQDNDPTIDLLLGDRVWRERWKTAAQAGESIVTFLATEYSTRMAGIGYLPMSLEAMVKIRSYDRRLPLYYLALFSRHQMGLKFWHQVRKYADDQLKLDL